VLSQVSGWGTMYYLISASMSCTIQSSLGYCVPSQGMYWYILYHPRACTGISWAKIRCYCGTSHQCWIMRYPRSRAGDIMHYPKIRAGVLYIGHVLVYSGPKFGPKTNLEAVHLTGGFSR